MKRLTTDIQWRLLSQSATGTSHLRRGRGCEDACCIKSIGSVCLLALADGAGSAPQSAAGSKLAVQVGMDWLTANPITRTDPDWRGHIRRGMGRVHAALRRKAQREQKSLDDFATTLLMVIAWPHGLLAAQVGDGAIIVETITGQFKTVLRDTKQGPANLADFITDDRFEKVLRFSKQTGEIRSLVGMTDGLEGIALRPSGIPHVGFVRPFLQCARQQSKRRAKKALKQFLQSDRLRSATDDDVTLAIATTGRPIRVKPLSIMEAAD